METIDDHATDAKIGHIFGRMCGFSLALPKALCKHRGEGVQVCLTARNDDDRRRTVIRFGDRAAGDQAAVAANVKPTPEPIEAGPSGGSHGQ